MQPGIHLFHKPEGPTSFSLVQACLNATHPPDAKRRPKICHGGTLDPFASGLLLILVEPATRLFDYVHGIPKIYDATVRWGVETDNGDPDGRVTFTGNPSILRSQQLQDALAGFIGWHDQIPPPTSAKRIDGERAYLKAHRGEPVNLPPSQVYLHEARWLSHDLPRESKIRLSVRGGYYVRSLARDLGRLIGCGAHLTTLHRTAIGPWVDPGADRTVAIPGRHLLSWAHTRILSDQDIGDLRQGRNISLGDLLPPIWPLPPGFPDPQAPIRGFHLDRFCFLLKPENGRLSLLTALRGGL
jgi:tRNA pseudouridine55 synthase